MYKFEIYQHNKVQPLTIVEADCFKVNHEETLIRFYKNQDVIAFFNVDNISGFKVLEEV